MPALPHRTIPYFQLFFHVVISLVLVGHRATPARGETNAAGSLGMKLEKSRLYLGESTNLSVTLLSGTATIRNMSYPVVPARDIAIDEFAPPRQREYLHDGGAATSYQFTTLITPRTTGLLRLGPASLKGEMAVPAGGSGSFFGETTTQEISFSSPPLDLVVLPLPSIGRPADFSGVVGRFTLHVAARPTTLQSGDPLTVTTRISGTGNLSVATCPELQIPGFKNYPVKTSLSAATLQCTQVVIPEKAGATPLPQVHFSFFNASSARYVSLHSMAIPLIVTETELPQTPGPTPAPQVSSPPATRHLFYWWFWALIAVAAGGMVLRRRRRTRVNAQAVPYCQKQHHDNSSYQAYIQTAERALADHDIALFYEALFRAVELLRPEPAALTFAGYEDLVTYCDAVRYGRFRPDHENMAAILMQVKKLRPDAS